ncbi:MAG TPA: bifunctional hydroxymethylpyrimidine kinase/phosphomethylpyrimidine kinase, partial [Campylobacterales bacterium]|nr:bifunctional hydroxymethylpyrimidine kinase/phosphomethylpyrimidine kinase [Campylobacterales bacterium]
MLTIGGSDSGGGAGIQADLKTFEAHEVFATTAITALTAQNTVSVSDIHQPKSEFVSAQIKAVLDDFEVSAIKIGMLFSKEIIKTVYKELENYKGPLVLDTVFVSRTNSLLLRENAVEELKRLFEKATIITPNMYEAYRLFGYRTGCSESLEQLRSQPCPVLVKNHMTKKDDKEYSVDILYTKNS